MKQRPTRQQKRDLNQLLKKLKQGLTTDKEVAEAAASLLYTFAMWFQDEAPAETIGEIGGFLFDTMIVEGVLTHPALPMIVRGVMTMRDPQDRLVKLIQALLHLRP